MGQFDRLLQRQPQIDAAVVEEVRARAMARLSAYSDPRPSTEAAESDDGTDGTADWDAEGHMGWRAEAPTEAHDSPVYGSDAALSAAAAQIEIVVVDHGEPIALPSFDPWLCPVGDQHDASAVALRRTRSRIARRLRPMRTRGDRSRSTSRH
jgi:hypothetical protein